MKNLGAILGIVLVVVLVLVLFSGAWMMGLGRFGVGRMMPGYSPFGMMGGYGFHPFAAVFVTCLLGALLVGGIVLLIIWGVPKASGASASAPSGDASLDILKARYARGEINKEQFDTMKKDLGG